MLRKETKRLMILTALEPILLDSLPNVVTNVFSSSSLVLRTSKRGSMLSMIIWTRSSEGSRRTIVFTVVST